VRGKDFSRKSTQSLLINGHNLELMARIITKVGDVFCVKLTESTKKYFQLIAFDLTQLNSDVIRAFKKEYPIETNTELLDVIKDEVEFYTHCNTNLGIKLNLWEKVGCIEEIGKTADIIFRGSSDSGSKPGEQIKLSSNWYIWRIGDGDFTKVGKLVGENRKAEIGIIVNPYDVVERLSTGKFSFFYPDYE